MAGNALVVRGGHLGPERKPGLPFGRVPGAPRPAEVRRRCRVVHRRRGARGRLPALDAVERLGDVEVRAVEIGDGPIGELLEVREQVVDALDAARGVVAEHRHRAIETGAGIDPLGGHGHLGLDAVQLVPAPGVDLLGVAVHAEPPPDADGVELAADRVGLGRLGAYSSRRKRDIAA